MPPAPEPGLHQEDDLLQLVLTCCHPALAVEARVALTLRHVAGLSVPEIAAGFLVAEETMAKRLVRARTKIRQTAISFELPGPEGLAERLSSVQAVLYLVFTEGHLASGDGPAVRAELCDEAIWLARQVHRLLPDDAETTGLLALMLLQHSRADARHDDAGRLLTFAEQDRARWDHRAITEARALLGTTGRGPSGRTRCRRPSRRCTPRLRARTTSTGRGSPTSTGSSPGSPPHRSSPSTGRSPWAGPTGRGPRSPCSRRCWPMGGWPTTRRAVRQHEVAAHVGGRPAARRPAPRRAPAGHPASSRTHAATAAARSSSDQSTCRHRTTSADPGPNGGFGASPRTRSTATPAPAALAGAAASMRGEELEPADP